MKKTLIILISILSTNLWASDLEKVASAYSFEKSIELVKAQFQKMDLTLIAEVPHSKAAAKVDMKINHAHLLIFGNPQVGTLLMQSDLSVGIELPLKILIWQNEDGQVMLGYKKAVDLLSNYKLKDKTAVLKKMDGAMLKIVEVVK